MTTPTAKEVYLIHLNRKEGLFVFGFFLFLFFWVGGARARVELWWSLRYYIVTWWKEATWVKRPFNKCV